MNLDQALKHLTYGYYILATRKAGKELVTRDEDWVSAGTVSWAIQSSFKPPFITVAIEKDSDLNETIQKAQSFSLTILRKEDKKLIKQFAEHTAVDHDKHRLNGVNYRESEKTGAPLLDCGLVTFDCKLSDALTTKGDHILFVGEVVDVTTNGAGEPIKDADARFEYAGTERS